MAVQKKATVKKKPKKKAYPKDWSSFLTEFRSKEALSKPHHPSAHKTGNKVRMCRLCDKSLPSAKEVFSKMV